MSSFKWESLKSMPTKRVFGTAVSLSGQLYVVGGCDAAGVPLNCLESYAPQSRQWKVLSAMPTKRAAVSAVAVGSQLVAIGGVSISQQPLDAVEVYDAERRKWRTGSPLKDKLLGLAAVVRDGCVIVIGGMSIDTNPKDYMMSYDLKEDRWQTLPPMPTPRYATFAFIINDKLYVIGGRQGKIPIDAFEMYDFGTKLWTKLPNVPSKRVFALYTHSDTHIVSLGGLHEKPQDGFSDVTEVFNLETETWKIGKSMSEKRGDFAVGYIGGKVVVAGGLGNQGRPMADAEAYDIAADSWTPIADIPSAHCSCAYFIFEDRLHVIGGLGMNGQSGAMEALICKT